MVDIKIENVDIPIEEENINLKGSIYNTEKTPPKAPWVIVLAGLLSHRETKFVKSYIERFANAGYYVLSYDYRGHGETVKETGRLNYFKMILKIYTDIHKVISWILDNQSNRILKDQIILFGRSAGGAIILTHGFIDERAKILIALCTRYDYNTVDFSGRIKYPQDLIEKISPKYFLKKDLLNNDRILLGHCKDDGRIPFENVIQIKEDLGLSDENLMIFEDGDHSFKGHRDELFELCIEFLKKI